VVCILLVMVGCKETKPEPVIPKERVPMIEYAPKIEHAPVMLPRVTSVWVTRQHSDGKFRQVEAFGGGVAWEFIEPRTIESDNLLYGVQWRLESDIPDGEWKWTIFAEDDWVARCTSVVARDAAGTSIRCTVNFYDKIPPPGFVFSLDCIFTDAPSLTFRFWPGDITQDGFVNSNDRGLLKLYFGSQIMHGRPALIDLTMDGIINSNDSGMLKFNYGNVYTR